MQEPKANPSTAMQHADSSASQVAMDSLGRPLHDLRISVTDRCNFRCVYCMPRAKFGAGFPFLPQRELLTFEEITRVATAFAARGVQKLRITGGEPLMRRDLDGLIEMLSTIPGIAEVAMTTNGSLLTPEFARRLKAAGLTRVSISLDSLRDDVFMMMNDANIPVQRVLAAIDAAVDAGLWPVKINMVVKKGLNDGCVLDMARHFRETGHVLRFIEYMDVGTSNGWNRAEVLTAAEILNLLQSEWPLEPVAPVHPGEVAKRYRYLDGAGEIGIIASVTQPFCGDCTRLRMSADGQLYTCLFSSQGHDVKRVLRSPDGDIDAFLRSVWGARADQYSVLRHQSQSGGPRVEMSHIGG